VRLHRRRAASPPPSPADLQEREIVDALAAMRDTSVREVMTPRVDVVALSEPVAVADITRAVKESGHSRFPVYAGDLDHLSGVLFVKDLFRMGDEATPEAIARRLRKPFLIPETARVMDVLGEMRRGRKAFAVVVDEHGGTAGIVTLEDVLEEIVGEIHDEYDEVPKEFEQVAHDATLVDARVPIRDFNEKFGVELPQDGEYDTVGGFIFKVSGRIPENQEVIQYDNLQFTVTKKGQRRIRQVKVRRLAGGGSA
jgi:CBS domain containing-hemolysin-like protein